MPDLWRTGHNSRTFKERPVSCACAEIPRSSPPPLKLVLVAFRLDSSDSIPEMQILNHCVDGKFTRYISCPGVVRKAINHQPCCRSSGAAAEILIVSGGAAARQAWHPTDTINIHNPVATHRHFTSLSKRKFWFLSYVKNLSSLHLPIFFSYVVSFIQHRRRPLRSLALPLASPSGSTT